MVRGWATSIVNDRNRDSRIFVGTAKNPIAIIRRGEIADYLDEEFFEYFECWRIAQCGYGLPYGEGWAQYPNMFINTLTTFSEDWRIITGAHI